MNSADPKKTTLADDVEKDLLRYLKERHLQPGDILPRETDLAESLRVSRHRKSKGSVKP